MFRLMVFAILFLFGMQTFAAVVEGNPNGKVTVVEVYDYQCIHCHADFPVVEKLIAKNPNIKLRLMPAAILNKTSIYEAAAAISAAHQGDKFAQFTQIAMSSPPFNTMEVNRLMSELGLDTKAFKQSMHSKFNYEQMMQGLRLLKLEKSGTPLFVIYPTHNPHISKVLRGYQPYSVLQEVVRHAQAS